MLPGDDRSLRALWAVQGTLVVPTERTILLARLGSVPFRALPLPRAACTHKAVWEKATTTNVVRQLDSYIETWPLALQRSQ